MNQDLGSRTALAVAVVLMLLTLVVMVGHADGPRSEGSTASSSADR